MQEICGTQFTEQAGKKEQVEGDRNGEKCHKDIKEYEKE